MADTPDSAPNPDYGLTVHAVLPPPVTGMTLCTDGIAEAMSKRVNVRRFSWSNGSRKITKWFKFVKACRAMSTPWRLLFGPRPRHGVFYMPANAGMAVVYNMLAIGAARLRGYRCVLHHHYFRYVERFQWRMRLLTRFLGPNDLEIVLCPEMERLFRKHYGQTLPIAIIPSTVQLLPMPKPSPSESVTPRRDAAFCLGHLTNLQISKGLDLVIEVFRTLRSRGRNVRLVLAGPTDTAVEKRLIDDAQAEFGELLDYRGPVYNDDKRRFYQDVDAIIYPTRNDAQPLVVSESLSFGKPVVTFARGCIPGLLGPELPLAYPVDSDYVTAAVAQVEAWIDSPKSYAQVSQQARHRYDDLLVEARTALEQFANWICCEPDGGFVRRGGSAAERQRT